MPDSLWPIAGLFVALGAILIIASFTALRRRRPLRMTLRLLWALVFFSVGGALIATALGIQGYHALTREEVVAVVQTFPVAEQQFRATLRFADGRELTFNLAGDELYVDAHILKWHAWANILGLHTAYELDRIAGRFKSIDDERRKPRTVFALAPERSVDLFALRQRYLLLSPLLDAEYGSATFIGAEGLPATYEVRVSPTGLLVRRVDTAS
jgi:hypothetical protein